MTNDSTHTEDDDAAVVGRVYDVALDPTLYEAMVDAWEAAFPAGDDLALSSERSSRIKGHMQRAGQFLDRIVSGDDATTLEDMLNMQAPFSALAVNPHMHVLASNFGRDTQKFSAKQDLQSITFLSDDAASVLTEVLQAAFQTGKGGVHFLPRVADRGDNIDLVKVHLSDSPGHGRIAMVVFSHVKWDAEIETRLARIFGFSKTELEILRYMLELKSRSDIARLRNRSAETIKRQISGIFQKVGCGSSGDLIRLLMSFINFIADQASDTALQSSLQSFISPASGRSVHFVGRGAPVSDRICLHLPGPYCLSHWPKAAEERARKVGLRVISPIRPGYGPARKLDKQSDLLGEITHDLCAILDRETTAKVPIITQSNDIIFAVKFARKFPEKVSAIIACGGSLPFLNAAQYKRMDKWHRFILSNARHAPWALPFIVKAGFELTKRVGQKAFLEMVHENVPGDLEAIRDKDVFEAFLEGSQYTLSKDVSAHHAFAETLSYFASTAWQEDLDVLKGNVPLILVNGSLDPMAPAETLAEFQLAYPWIETHVFPGDGEFVFFRQWPMVMDRVLGACDLPQ